MGRRSCDLAFLAPCLVLGSARTSVLLNERPPAFRTRRPRSRAAAVLCSAEDVAGDDRLQDQQFVIDQDHTTRGGVERDEDVMLYDELQSDKDYVVLDGKDIDMLVRELQDKGLDDLGSSADGVYETWLRAAEAVDEAKKAGDTVVFDKEEEDELEEEQARPAAGVAQTRNGASASSFMPSRANPDETLKKPFGGTVGEPAMEYFTEENVAFMPSWARAAFLKGIHHEIEDGSRRMSKTPGSKRLDAMVQADREASVRESRAEKHASPPEGLVVEQPLTESPEPSVTENVGPVSREGESGNAGKSENDTGDDVELWSGQGIYDCCVSDVADDYSVPVEFVIDILDTYGVSKPISPADGIRDRLTMEEIRLMLELLTSFDAIDLSERYSDHTLAELADHYELDLSLLMAICEEEGIYLALDSATRLQLTREDRVLDIARGTASLGNYEYSSLLDGLIVENK